MEEISALAATEVIEVLNNTEVSLISKIPYKVLKFLQTKSNEYAGTITFEEGTFSEQNISEDAKAVLAVIYTDYFCNDEEKSEIRNIFDENQKKYDAEKAEKYNPDNIFKNEESIKEENIEEEKKEELMVITPKEKWYQRFWNKVKRIFK